MPNRVEVFLCGNRPPPLPADPSSLLSPSSSPPSEIQSLSHRFDESSNRNRIVCNPGRRPQAVYPSTNWQLPSSIIITMAIIIIVFNSNHQSITAAHQKIRTHGTSSKMRYYKNYQPYNSLLGQPISLPCNITPPTSDDDVSLILWYRNDLSTPIYTVDARGTNNLNMAKHFHDPSVLTDRVTFNITYPISYLRFEKVIETDTAEYRCRVDFRRDRTINRVMQLNVIVPAKKLSIYDTKNNYINDIAGPFNEDSPLNLTCESEGGNPLPKLKWWKSDIMISDRCTNPRKGVVQNVIQFKKVLREHLMMPLTCESSNTNLTVPASKTILIDLNLKPTEVIIVKPLHNMTVGQKVELVCQSSGSRPPAKISWKKNQKILEHFSESTSDDGSVTTNYLTFTPAIEDDGKKLVCQAYNPQFKDFQLEDQLQLNIHYAPILSLLLGASAKQQEIVEGSSVYFDCNIKANPQVYEFGWFFNGDELMTTSFNNHQQENDKEQQQQQEDNDDDQQNQKRNIEIRNNSIIIKNVNAGHIGSYQCYAINSLGKTFSEIVNLNVKYVPVCANEKEVHYKIELFEQLTIECNVRSDPKEVIFFWEFNSSFINGARTDDSGNFDADADVIDDRDKFQTGNRKPLMTIHNEPESSMIQFTPRTVYDYGTLYCFAQNRIGRQREPCIFHISKSETPNAPQNCSLLNVTLTSFTVQCQNIMLNEIDGKNNQHQQQPEQEQELNLSKQPFQYFVLLIYNEINHLIRNITSYDQPYFRVSDLNADDFDNLNLFVYTINSNGAKSDKVRVQSNNLVGQPRKLEHIEHRINGKPFLLLMFIVVCLIASIGTFIFLLVYKVRQRRRQQQRPYKNIQIAKSNANQKMKKQHEKNENVVGMANVFDTIEIKDCSHSPSTQARKTTLPKNSTTSLIFDSVDMVETKQNKLTNDTKSLVVNASLDSQISGNSLGGGTYSSSKLQSSKHGSISGKNLETNQIIESMSIDDPSAAAAGSTEIISLKDYIQQQQQPPSSSSTPSPLIKATALNSMNNTATHLIHQRQLHHHYSNIGETVGKPLDSALLLSTSNTNNLTLEEIINNTSGGSGGIVSNVTSTSSPCCPRSYRELTQIGTTTMNQLIDNGNNNINLMVVQDCSNNCAIGNNLPANNCHHHQQCHLFHCHHMHHHHNQQINTATTGHHNLDCHVKVCSNNENIMGDMSDSHNHHYHHQVGHLDPFVTGELLYHDSSSDCNMVEATRVVVVPELSNRRAADDTGIRTEQTTQLLQSSSTTASNDPDKKNDMNSFVNLDHRQASSNSDTLDVQGIHNNDNNDNDNIPMYHPHPHHHHHHHQCIILTTDNPHVQQHPDHQQIRNHLADYTDQQIISDFPSSSSCSFSISSNQIQQQQSTKFPMNIIQTDAEVEKHQKEENRATTSVTEMSQPLLNQTFENLGNSFVNNDSNDDDANKDQIIIKDESQRSATATTTSTLKSSIFKVRFLE